MLRLRCIVRKKLCGTCPLCAMHLPVCRRCEIRTETADPLHMRYHDTVPIGDLICRRNDTHQQTTYTNMFLYEHYHD